MDKGRIMFYVSQNNFRKWLINPRIYIVIIMLALYIQSIVAPIAMFCSTFGYKVSPFVFPYLMTERNVILIVMLLLVLLLCDAPFIESEQPYIITRSGRKIWVMGQVAYIFLASIIFVALIAVFSVAFLFPYIEINAEWGKVLGTFAQTSVAAQNGITLPFNTSLYLSYTPVSASLMTFALCSLVSFFLGMVIFFFNLNISLSAGAIVATTLILWQVVVTRTSTVFTNFSPVSWVSLSNIDTNGATLFPTLSYVMMVLVTMIALLVIGSVYSIRKRDIDVLKPV